MVHLKVHVMMDLMLHLNGYLEITLKAIKDVQEKDAFDVLLDGAPKYEHLSAVEGALDFLSEDTPTFEV